MPSLLIFPPVKGTSILASASVFHFWVICNWRLLGKVQLTVYRSLLCFVHSEVGYVFVHFTRLFSLVITNVVFSANA